MPAEFRHHCVYFLGFINYYARALEQVLLKRYVGLETSIDITIASGRRYV